MSIGSLVCYRAGTWLIDECQIAFFYELSYVKKSGPTFFVVIFYVICLTVINLSGILDTTDNSFMQTWVGSVLSFPIGFSSRTPIGVPEASKRSVPTRKG